MRLPANSRTRERQPTARAQLAMSSRRRARPVRHRSVKRTLRVRPLAQLDQRIAVASDALKAAEAHVDTVHGALTGALQDKQVLDRLRLRMLEAYRATESNKDRTTMDAIALQRFAQSTGDSATNGEEK